MATFSNPKAFYGMSATTESESVGVSGGLQIGPTSTTLSLTGTNFAYAVKFDVAATVAPTLVLATGAITGATSGTSQVETATVVAASGATSNGNLAVTVTAAGVTGSPLVFSVALTTATHTSATLIATAIKAAFDGNAALTAVYTVGGSGAAITLTRITPAANDSTLKIAIAAGLGVDAITDSTNTTSGVQATKIYRIANQTYDREDFQGASLTGVVGVSSITGFMVVSETGATVDIVMSPYYHSSIIGAGVVMQAGVGGFGAGFNEGTVTFTCDTASVFTVYVFGIL